MPDDLPPVGFWSYTTSDDTAARGRLSQLRRLLADELQQKIGRAAVQQVRIWQDAQAIPHGTEWRNEIHKGIDESSFFIPIVTPAFLQSKECGYEVMRFREREKERGRADLIFPFHYIETDDLDPDRTTECEDPAVLTLLRDRQMFDFRRLRLRDPLTEDVALALDAFSSSIRAALRRRTSRVPSPPPPPSAPQSGDIESDGPDYPDMVLIPKGAYLRGVPDTEEEREKVPKEWRGKSSPQREVTISAPFWMGRYPITRGEFAAFVNDTGYKTADKAWTFEADSKGSFTWEERSGRDWRNPGFEQTDRHPVVCVHHADAMAYTSGPNC